MYQLLRIIVRLTAPPEAPEGEDAERERAAVVKSYDSTAARRRYVADIVRSSLLGVVMKMLSEPLSHQARARTEDDNNLIELCLYLFKGLLEVPNPPPSAAGAGVSHLHEDLVVALGGDAVLLMLCMLARLLGLPENAGWTTVLLSVFTTLLGGADVEALVRAGTGPPPPRGSGARRESAETSAARAAALRGMLEKERAARAATHALAGPRHSRFGGAFQVSRGDGLSVIVSSLARPVEDLLPQVCALACDGVYACVCARARGRARACVWTRGFV